MRPEFDTSLRASQRICAVPPTLRNSESLVGLKGIDVKRKNFMVDKGIHSAVELLLACSTPDLRKKFAETLLDQEKKNCVNGRAIWIENYTHQVTSWVKQANLLRIEGMDYDTAYLLMQMGVRNAEDLAQVDISIVHPLLQSYVLSHPEFKAIDVDALTVLVDNARFVSDQYWDEAFTAAARRAAAADKTIDYQPAAGSCDGVVILNVNVREHPIPYHLFRKEDRVFHNQKIIPKGLGFLQDVEEKLPLPHSISGYVKIQDGSNPAVPLYNATVTISGVFGPDMKKDEKNSDPFGYTDFTGRFLLKMPERYNLREVITFTISQGVRRQQFVFRASEIIDHVAKTPLYQLFQELLGIVQEYQNPESTERSLDELDGIIRNLTEKIRAESGQNGSLSSIYRSVFTNGSLCADFTQEPFILSKDIFEHGRPSPPRTLPSVHLMGSDQDAVKLYTDTAPSRIFSYSMLQRLVEPAIHPSLPTNSGRIPLTQPVNVMNFKKTVAESPNAWPQMSSLGIGYILKMHQAWVPDGFALGNLLYSLVLAPGEEQRLVVRENKQHFELSDDAAGSEGTSESYRTSQTDDTTAAYQYAMDQMSNASSHMDYSTRTSSFGASGSFGGFGAAFGGMFGLSGSLCKSSGEANSSASQRNTHNEASNAAQAFQHNIQTASNKISQAKRLSISMGTSTQSDSVATRIIANHNHSHAMTIQYWEVTRRYNLETCIEGVDLVLFVPLQMVNFLNQNHFTDDISNLTRTRFENRYAVLLDYADDLLPWLPERYQSGISLLKRFAALPSWKLQSNSPAPFTVTLQFFANVMDFDNLQATLYLKNGSRINGTLRYIPNTLNDRIETTYDLKKTIRSIRCDAEKKVSCTASFALSSQVTSDDLSYIRIHHSCNQLEYQLYRNPNAMTDEGITAAEVQAKWLGKQYDLAQDNDDSDNDRKKIAYWKKLLPEAYVSPTAVLSERELNNLAALTIFDADVRIGDPSVMSDNAAQGDSLTAMASSGICQPDVNIHIHSSMPVLRYSELQQIEETLQHVSSRTLFYSQVVWASLTPDERALMLEQYTVDMDFSDIQEMGDVRFDPNYDPPNRTQHSMETQSDSENVEISLLNCIDVKNLLGFYGNCMLFPFTYPQELANKIHKTAGELQDDLYRYHTNYFRVPTTSISLPTDGMIGEAVLSQTNVSEKIDLTRFWNWKDSPIDTMPIDGSYLNGNDYLAGKSTRDIQPMNLAGATATAPVTAADLIQALVSRQTPKFDNITGLDNLKEVLNNAANTTAAGRDNALNSANDIAKAAGSHAFELAKQKAENEFLMELEKLRTGAADTEKTDGSSTGESTSGTGSTTPGSGSTSGDKNPPNKNDKPGGNQTGSTGTNEKPGNEATEKPVQPEPPAKPKDPERPGGSKKPGNKKPSETPSDDPDDKKDSRPGDIMDLPEDPEEEQQQPAPEADEGEKVPVDTKPLPPDSDLMGIVDNVCQSAFAAIQSGADPEDFLRSYLGDYYDPDIMEPLLDHICTVYGTSLEQIAGAITGTEE